MSFVNDLKREFKCADACKIAFFAAISVIFCLISHMFCSGMELYFCILLPVFAVPVQIFGAVRLIMFTLAGASAGMAVGGYRFCSKRSKRTSLIFYFLLISVSALWAPVVFGLASFIIGLLISVISLVICYFVMRSFLQTSLIAGYSIILFALWNIYCFLLNFCIILLN